MGGTVIKAGAVVKHCIIAENVVIGENAEVGAMPEGAETAWPRWGQVCISATAPR